MSSLQTPPFRPDGSGAAHGDLPTSPANHPPDWSQYFGQAEQVSMMICADSQSGIAAGHLEKIATALGHRVLCSVPLNEADARLSATVDVDAVVVACSGTEPELEALLARLDTMGETQGLKLVVIVDLAGLDHVHALLRSPNVALLCQPHPEDVVVAMVALSWQGANRTQLADIARDGERDQIARLSDQLVRLSSTIEALVQNRLPEPPPPWPAEPREGLRSPARGYNAYVENQAEDEPLAVQVRALLRARRLREQVIGEDIFADPAWDILLDLLAARLEGNRVSVSSLCIAAVVPPTTALRWIRQLTDRGLLRRQADPKDGRRIFIALSDEASDALLRWFRESRVHLLAATGMG